MGRRWKASFEGGLDWEVKISMKSAAGRLYEKKKQRKQRGKKGRKRRTERILKKMGKRVSLFWGNKQKGSGKMHQGSKSAIREGEAELSSSGFSRERDGIKSLRKEGKKGIYEAERVGTAVGHMPCESATKKGETKP